MNLKAIHDGEIIIGETMERQEWKDLKLNVRDGFVKLTMPCCNEECTPCESKHGLRFFRHKRGTTCSVSNGETKEHLYMKARIARGCHEAGYEVDTEVEHNGWRADVFAKNAKWKFAFEAQWSPQTYEETVERQKRYEKDNIFGVWLFRKMPDQSVSSTDVQLEYPLPMFVAEGDWLEEPKVHGLDVETFVKEIVSGHFSYRSRILFEPVQIIMLEIAETSCSNCKRVFHVLRFNNNRSSLIDVHGGQHFGWYDIFPEGVEYSPDVIKAINVYKTTTEGRNYAIADIRSFYSQREKQYNYYQACPFCGTDGRIFIGSFASNARIVGHLHLAIPLPENSSVEGTHWCHSESKHFCPK